MKTSNLPAGATIRWRYCDDAGQPAVAIGEIRPGGTMAEYLVSLTRVTLPGRIRNYGWDGPKRMVACADTSIEVLGLPDDPEPRIPPRHPRTQRLTPA